MGANKNNLIGISGNSRLRLKTKRASQKVLGFRIGELKNKDKDYCAGTKTTRTRENNSPEACSRANYTTNYWAIKERKKIGSLAEEVHKDILLRRETATPIHRALYHLRRRRQRQR